MIYWLTALLVWMATGARVGRVIVRPATTVRVAIVVGVASVAAAATVSIPEVADRIDGFVRDGNPGHTTDLAARIALALWVSFTAATSAVAAAAWPVISRKSLRNTALVFYSVGLVVVVLALLGFDTFAWSVVALGGIFIVVTALRNLDQSPLGRGIGIFAVGTAFVVVGSIDLATQTVSDDKVSRLSPSWVWSVAGLLISLGAVWILVEIWIRARLLIRRVRGLHKVMVGRFPEVLVDDAEQSTTVLRSSDQVAHIMDALYLQAGGGISRNHPQPPPVDAVVRARAVAGWARDPLANVHVDTNWISPPAGISTRRWVGDIAKAYSAGA